MKRYVLSAIAFIFALSLITIATSSTAQAGWKDKMNTKSDKKEEKATYPPYTGPKKRIAIYRFVDKVKSGGSNQIGSPMLEQLSEELFKSNRFIVVVRGEDLDDIDEETKLGMSGRVKEGQETASDELLGAQVIIKGAITEFKLDASKDANTVKIPKGVTGGKWGGNVGVGSSKATVKITLKMIDPATGAVIWQDSATGQAKQTKFKAGVDIQGVVVGKEISKDTPLGAATLEAIQKAVNKIITQMDTMPWSASIMKVTGNKVVIRAGQDSGLQPGDVLDLLQKGEVLEDPDTGEKIAMDPEKVGTVQVTKIQTKVSICIIKSGQASTGMLVMMPQ